MVLDPAGKR
uniref:Uncharacterized protein n=1 Tax=Arundo donax TaxID=35708 RepID=A0A0A9F9L8_ARUDO